MEVIIFMLVSIALWGVVTLILKKVFRYKHEYFFDLKGIIYLTLMFVCIGSYGVIFKGGSLIEDLHMTRTPELQLAALGIALMYIYTFFKYGPRW
ncbi:hypothetical protein LOH54_08940 [Sulfurimonas sp. HSL-3221]|uniref:Uncharacterized protein n=1 Tax=Sulfurimonas diazotrophicus TaxID=3131939 RepID=A0ABZ3H9E8_9BACT|nr:hypothetical protein [Sulfurimonas sp. HSL-3221]UFS61782.1 hypothetical protein LOH54_08940 [Sulfurimonas sp. HSL-3221]